MLMEGLKIVEKYEQFNQQGELVCVNWYLETNVDAMIISTIPLTVVYAFLRKQFPDYSDLLLLNKAQHKAAFNAFNAYTAENCDRLKELFPECTPIEEDTEVVQYLTDYLDRWISNDDSVFHQHSNPTDFPKLQYDIYGQMIIGFELMEGIDFSNDFKFISRSEFEQKFQNQEQVDCYLDHYQLLNRADVRFLSMYESDMHYHMPILDNKPVFILIEQKQECADAA
jgi:hypothetical protein